MPPAAEPSGVGDLRIAGEVRLSCGRKTCACQQVLFSAECSRAAYAAQTLAAVNTDPASLAYAPMTQGGA